MKKVVSIQDVSCVGKCSQTVALPIISSMGIETAILPTSILSTHTAFKEFTFKKLTEELYKIKEHWKREKFQFDLIYIGYTGSEEILDFVLEFISEFKTRSNIIIFDPAMADNGEMYQGISKNIFAKIKEVAKKTDIIRLNRTEATFLLEKPYKEQLNLEEGQKLVKELQKLNKKQVVMTGIEKDNKIGALGYDGNAYYNNFEIKYPKNYHGTGDIFTSTLAGSLVKGKKLEEAIKISTKFTTECVRITYEDKDSEEYGVNFEQAIPYLLKLIL